jgi:hypothetical protein
MKVALLFILFSMSVSAQLKGVVVDENNKPIPYVNIWVENENIGTTSDEDGFFIINASEKKIFVLSAVGYELKKTALNNNEKVVLKIVLYKLDEIVITKRKQDKELEIGNAEKIRHTQLSGNNPWIYGKLFHYDSLYASIPYLKKIVFFSDSDIKEAKLKIRIFEFDGTTPTNDLLEEDLIVTVKKGMRKNTIDISKYNLRFPEKGIVIGLEWMIIEENRHDFEYRAYQSKKTVTMENYQPSLVVNYSKEEDSFNYSQGKWVRSKIFLTEKRNNEPWYGKILMPAINLILSN